MFVGLDSRFRFTLDGASSPGNALLPRHSTAENPLSWAGERVFCNPPWSDIPAFVELAAVADLAVLLVPARCNSKWFHRALELGAKPEFFQGRPRFRRDNEEKAGCPFDCCLLVWNKEATC